MFLSNSDINKTRFNDENEKIAAQAQTEIAQTSERKVYLGWEKHN